jgi:membrane protein DedA with SNARE-associated domain
MGITHWIANFATDLIGLGGYPAVFFLMILESMIVPLPSEAVMPFAGFLIAEGRFTFTGVIAASTLGSIVGSLLSYAMGRYGGMPFIDRFGKYFLLNKKDLDTASGLFTRYGKATIFISRFIPVIRHLISIPAGMFRMPLLPFSISTIIGAGLWNAFLTYCGMVLKQNWATVMKYSHTIDYVVVALGVLFVIYFYYSHFRRSKS